MGPELEHHYHDGYVSAARVGPRQEIALRVILDSIWNGNVQRTVEIRFGGIENYESVAEYCELLAEKCQEDDEGIGPRIDALHYHPTERSHTGDLRIVLDVDGVGQINVVCRSVRESVCPNE
jgi:hypothetical protein